MGAKFSRKKKLPNPTSAAFHQSAAFRQFATLPIRRLIEFTRLQYPPILLLPEFVRLPPSNSSREGFAVGSAALVSLALFCVFVSRAAISTVDVLTPKVFISLLVGAMLPYLFSAMMMKSVGSAASEMVEEVRRKFNTIPGLMEGTAEPDYATCLKISTDASIEEVFPPGALVIPASLLVGIFFGVETLSGVLAGSLVSSVQIAISASNTGGASDNAKKYIEAGASEHARTLGPKGSDPRKAAVIGDTIGDRLKDASGPSLNILIKLMAVESLVFAPFFLLHMEAFSSRSLTDKKTSIAFVLNFAVWFIFGMFYLEGRQRKYTHSTIGINLLIMDMYCFAFVDMNK